MATDFRAYLQKQAPYALAYTGNDARIDPTKAGYTINATQPSYTNTTQNRVKVQDYITGLYKQYLAGPAPPNKNIGSIYGAGGGGQVAAPYINLSAINSQARKDAANAVNPYYTKTLNDFVKQQQYEKAQSEAQAKTDIGNLQSQLDQTLKQNEITGQRTTQDVATNEANIATQADQYQTDQGAAADEGRIAQAKQLATGGLTGSGVGTGQQLKSQTAQNTAEARQGEEFKQQKQQQDLFQSRTFEDLTRSGGLAKEAKAKGEKQVQFNLNDYIKHQTFALSSQKQSLEKARLQDVAQKQQDIARLSFQKFIANLSDPAQIVAAQNKYGGMF